jgi:hypothetical protein
MTGSAAIVLLALTVQSSAGRGEIYMDHSQAGPIAVTKEQER